MNYDILSILDGTQVIPARLAVLEYSDSGELIYEDYSNLDNFLKNEFVPTYVKKSRDYRSGDNSERNLISVYLVRLVSLKLNREEFIHAVSYLRQLGVIVIGTESFLCSELENYHYVLLRRKKSELCNSSFDDIMENVNEIQLRKSVMKDYQRNRTIDLRNELVRLHMKLLKKITNTYAMKMGVSASELIGYGCEGLIHAIEKYDPSHNNEFSTFAFPIVKGYILKEISEWNGYKQRNFYYKYISYKKKIEEKYHCSIVDNPDMMVDYILDEMIQDGKISKMVKKEYKTLIFMCDPDLVQKGIFFDDLVCYEEFEKQEEVMLNQFMKQDIWLAFQELDERERKVIEESFGLFGIKKKYLEEIGKEMHISKQRVSQIKDGTLRKIKTLEKVRGLKEYL